MEPLNVLASTIRKHELEVKRLQELWRRRVEADGSAKMPPALLPEMAYRDGLRDAWLIMTGNEWPVED